MADQTIITQYVVEAADAIKEAERFRRVINTVKSDLRTMVQTSGQSFRELGASLIKNLKGANAEDIGKFLGVDPATLNTVKELSKARQEAITLARKGISELGQEERRQAIESSKVVRDAKKQEAAAAREYEQVTKQGYGVMSSAAQAYGQQVQQVKQQIVSQSQATGQTYNQVAQQMLQAGGNANVLNSALKQLQSTTITTTSAISTLGNVAKYVFGALFGLNIFNVLRSFITLMQEATRSGYEFSKALFQLEVGSRALRRAGVDITSKEMLANLDKLREKFGVFSKKELVEGAAAFMNLVRDMGFTKEQIFELQDVIATLAIVNGRAMDEVQRMVALALSSGYTEGLQKLGVSINRVNIAARAMAMGFGQGYNQLTEHERAMATYSLMVEKATKYSDDLTRFLETQAGQLDKSTAALADAKVAIGDGLLPIQTAWNNELLILYNMLADVIDLLGPFIELIDAMNREFSKSETIVDDVSRAIETNVLKQLGPMGIMLDFIIVKFRELNTAMTTFAKIQEETGKAFLNIDWVKIKDSLNKPSKNIFGGEEVDLGTPSFGEDEAENSADSVREITDDLYSDLEKEKRNFNSRMAELERDYARDILKIERELARDLNELVRDLAHDITKISSDGRRKEAETIADYGRREEAEARKANNQVAEEEAKYRENQLQSEIEFQEQMQKLREGFLFNLEDALRERDARQILNLIRRYNLEKEQNQRQYNIENEERRRQHELRLSELAREREERRKELQLELEEKLAQIRAETALEIQERMRQFEWDKAERERRAAEEKEEREIKKKEAIEELKIGFNERLVEIVAALATEKEMTAVMLAAIGNEYKKVYGPNGVIETQIRYYINLLNALAAKGKNAKPTPFGVPSATTSLGGNNTSTTTSTYKRAEGGIMYADRPTTVTFGDKGLEEAKFTPMNRVGKDEGKVVYNDTGRDSKGMNGSVAIRVLLSPDLIGEIQENTLEQVANVMFEVQRRA